MAAEADQAGVIIEAVDALPTDLTDPTLRTRAERTLLAEAARHDAKALRILGRRILETIAPEIGEAHEQRLLEAEEQAAAAAARLTLVDDGHGKCHGRFTIPTLHGEMLRTHLMALANPRRHPRPEDADESRQPTITPQRLGEAFTAAPPTSTTADCSVHAITASPTTPATRSRTTPAPRSTSTAAREPRSGSADEREP